MQGSRSEDVGSDSTWQDNSQSIHRGHADSTVPLSTHLLEQQLDIDVRKLWLATMTDSRFARGFQGQRGYRDIKCGHWHREGKLPIDIRLGIG